MPHDGEGPHIHVLVEKRLHTTDDVLRELARGTGLPPREIGYAGRKDRHAVTRQWFSVPKLPDGGAESLVQRTGRVLEVRQHSSKLRTGQLEGNRFALVVRDVSEAESRRVQDVLDRLVARGLPNRYGKQRFGRGGRNVEKGTAILRADRLRVERRTAWLLVSAVQSAVFNEVLARRPFPLEQVTAGDVVIDHATGLVSHIDDLEQASARAARFEISATGPIFGTKMKRPTGAVATLEQAAMSNFGLPDAHQIKPPKGVRLYGSRRPLRTPIRNATCRWQDGRLCLGFDLQPGSYATTLIEELFPEGFDEGPEAFSQP